MANDWGLTCDVDGCQTSIVGLEDGWSPVDRDGVVCTDCWDYYRDHKHFPDEQRDPCLECLQEGDDAE